MSKKYTVREFLALDAVKKKRLSEKDPDQYKKLTSAAKANFDPDTDHEALALLTNNPKTSKTLADG
jgi:hypothetical protein